MTIYVDCDGVLANFDKRAEEILGMPPREFEDKFGSNIFWAALATDPNFFLNLELMPGAERLMKALEPHDPIILTGAPSNIPQAWIQKPQWSIKKFGFNQRIIVCQSKNKAMFARPGDHIIDDWPRHRKVWESQGGVWIHHDDVDSTLEKLKKEGLI